MLWGKSKDLKDDRSTNGNQTRGTEESTADAA